jgi:hypothetical protein
MPTFDNSTPRLAPCAVILLALLSVPAAAQTSADSTSRVKPAADTSVAAYGDTAKQSGVDTARGARAPDSAAKAGPDSASKARPDSASKSAPDSSVPAGASATAAPPADSVLSGACTSLRTGAVAPGLLLVLFRDSATEKERALAVTGAGGATAGAAPGGGEYVRVSSDSISSRDLADRLVQDPSVASISERTCPAGKP